MACHKRHNDKRQHFTKHICEKRNRTADGVACLRNQHAGKAIPAQACGNRQALLCRQGKQKGSHHTAAKGAERNPERNQQNPKAQFPNACENSLIQPVWKDWDAWM